MARSHSYCRHDSRHSCTCLHQLLDISIWCTILHYHWSWTSIWICSMTTINGTTRLQRNKNNIIPSNSQWNSRTIPSPTEVIHEGMSQSHHVDRFTSFDFARHPYHTKGRSTLYCSRASVWYNTTITWFDDRISETNTSDISNYVTKLKLIMQQLKAIPPRSTANRKQWLTYLYSCICMTQCHTQTITITIWWIIYSYQTYRQKFYNSEEQSRRSSVYWQT